MKKLNNNKIMAEKRKRYGMSVKDKRRKLQHESKPDQELPSKGQHLLPGDAAVRIFGLSPYQQL